MRQGTGGIINVPIAGGLHSENWRQAMSQHVLPGAAALQCVMLRVGVSHLPFTCSAGCLRSVADIHQVCVRVLVLLFVCVCTRAHLGVCLPQSHPHQCWFRRC